MQCLSLKQIEELLIGEMEPLEEEIWTIHLDECPNCRRRFDECMETPEVAVWRLAALEAPKLAETDQAILEKLKATVPSAIGDDGNSGAVNYNLWFRGDSLKGDPEPVPNEGGAKAAPGHAGLPSVPGFEIHGELGRGGMGVVYRATQTAYNRLVALKTILAGRLATREELGRFHDEAEAISRLRHPHIVQIFEVGQFDNRLYVVLEFVEGGTLADKIRGKPLPARSSAQLVESLARAMHYAHQRGIIHRDLKPANVLLHGRKAFLDIPEDADRMPEDWDFRRSMPKITDFGLAKLLDRNTTNGHTASGDVVGTPSYMAPEQAQGRSDTIGPTTDVYSLGAILYEMLTGRPPFQGATPMDTLIQVHTQEPVALRKLVRDIPASLETICLKCLRKEPTKRYRSAESLAEDLRLFLQGMPIQTRQLHPILRGIHGLNKRNGNWQTTSLIFVLSVIAGGSLVTLWMRDSPNTNAAGVKSNDPAVVWENASLRLRLAQRDCERGDILSGLSQMADLLEQSERDPNRAPFQEALHWNLSTWMRSTPTIELIASEPAESLAILNRRDDYELVVVGAGRKLERVSSNGDHGLTSWEGAQKCQIVSASPDGRWLAAWTDAGVRWWDLASGRLMAAAKPPNLTDLQGIDLSPDGLSLAARCRAPGGSVVLLTRPPEGSLITIKSFAERGEFTATAWHPQGRMILMGTSGGKLITADAQTSQSLHSRSLPAAVSSVAWLDDRTAIAGCGDGTIRFWNPFGPMTNEPAPIRAHSAGNVVLAAANGLLVSGGNDHLAKLWNAATGDLIATLPHPATILQVEWTRDGKRFVTRDALGSIRVWRIPAETESARFPFGAALLGRPSLSARGDLLVAVNAGRHVGMWQRTRAAWRKAETSLVNYAKLALASPDGSSYLTARTENGKGTVELWDVNSKRQTNRLAHDSPITAVQFRGDGQRLFTGTAAGRAFIWDVANATPERSFVHSGAVRCGAFGVDNRAILIGGDADAGGGEARVWSLEKAGEPLSPPLRHSDSVAAVAWETGGNTVRTYDARHLVRRWDIATGRQLPPPAPFSADAQVVAYNLAGDQCLVLEADNSLRLLVSGGKFVTLPVPMSSDWKSAMFSADGRWLLTAWSDGVRIWHAATGAAIGPTLKVTNLIDAEFVQDQPSILAWSETEATLFTLRAPLISTAAGWQRKLEMSSGMDWHMHGRPRFLDATEWKKFSAQ